MMRAIAGRLLAKAGGPFPFGPSQAECFGPPKEYSGRQGKAVSGRWPQACTTLPLAVAFKHPEARGVLLLCVAEH